MLKDFINDSSHWRKRADEMRDLAKRVIDDAAHKRLSDLAKEFERIGAEVGQVAQLLFGCEQPGAITIHSAQHAAIGWRTFKVFCLEKIGFVSLNQGQRRAQWAHCDRWVIFTKRTHRKRQ